MRFRRLLTTFLLILLVVLGFFTSSTGAEAEAIEPSVLLTIDDVPITTAIPEIINRTPTFAGRSNLPLAFVDYKIDHPQMMASNNADRRGIWRWTVPQKLDYGYQILMVTISNPNDLTDVKTSVFEFKVVRTDVNIIRLGIPKFLGIFIAAIAGIIAPKKLQKVSRED